MNQLEISKFPTLEYAANEAFNTLSTSLFYCGTDIKTILITSRYAVEGKSFVSMNLMRTLASLNTGYRFTALGNRWPVSYPFRYQRTYGPCSILGRYVPDERYIIRNKHSERLYDPYRARGEQFPAAFVERAYA